MCFVCGYGLSLFASLLFLVGVSGDLRVVVAVVCFSRLFHEPGTMEPRSFMMFLICLLAYPNVGPSLSAMLAQQRQKMLISVFKGQIAFGLAKAVLPVQHMEVCVILPFLRFHSFC